MNNINHKLLADGLPDTSDGNAAGMPRVIRAIALAAALFASVISLGINVYAGMLRAGNVTEQICTVATSLVAALCMHLAPLLWRFAPTRARFVLAVLWLLAVCGVLRGQVDVLAFANVHAADERAQTVAVAAMPSVAIEPAGRDLMAIEQDIAKTSIDLAHVDARRCVGECRSLRMRKVELSAQLALLNAEADEAKRRATEQDWRRDQVNRARELSESRRAEPGTALIAPWLGTTAARLDLLINVVLVVVLEGTACFCWYVVGLGAVATPRGAAVVGDRNATVSRLEVVASMLGMTPAGRVKQCTTHVATVAEGELVASDACFDPIMSNDDRRIKEIHEAVMAGRLKRNLVSIRNFLGCAQSDASRLNRLYIERFGKARGPRVVPMS